ncbi:MAG: hypothetical protein A3J28_17260 [Acidobacteria bacterium RIFCSPLOWO2_12_FULL_60_22]|nr:MAG: hypothetical protein A3J28_17260 [Acidobacteria bacterium RIFCSPLOWO2_12_FULL_60_22]
MESPIATGTLASAYIKAKLNVLASGYGSEIIWQKTLRIEELTETDLLRECSWVILSSGMRESVVRKKFPAIGEAFFDWVSAQEIVSHRDHCVRSALLHFRNELKIEAIAQSAQITYTKGFEALRDEIANDPIAALQQFPYIGPATSHHIAKNIGLAFAKPDRHLSRLAALSGYERPSDLCCAISEYIGDPVSVVDIVLWRFATLHQDYLTAFLRAEQEDA